MKLISITISAPVSLLCLGSFGQQEQEKEKTIIYDIIPENGNWRAKWKGNPAEVEQAALEAGYKIELNYFGHGRIYDSRGNTALRTKAKSGYCRMGKIDNTVSFKSGSCHFAPFETYNRCTRITNVERVVLGLYGADWEGNQAFLPEVAKKMGYEVGKYPNDDQLWIYAPDGKYTQGHETKGRLHLRKV